MSKKTITEEDRLRRQAALRSARYREMHASRPDVRAIDKALSEALAIHARTLSPEASTALLGAIVGLAATGLVYQGYGAKASKSRVAKRLSAWISGSLSSGGVKAAAERASVTASRSEV